MNLFRRQLLGTEQKKFSLWEFVTNFVLYVKNLNPLNKKSPFINISRTRMELDIIVEGFRQSMSMHNVIFNKLIGNGDSSVMKKLSLVKPYGPGMFIKKIECVNHILRNYCNRIVDMSTRRKRTSGMVRKILKDRRLKLR